MDADTVVEANIRLVLGNEVFQGRLSGEQNPVTVRRVVDLLPIEARPRTEFNAFLFRIPVHVGVETPSRVVDAGDIAYWPQKHAFCIFFDTPENGDLPSPVNVIGHVSDAAALSAATTASELRILRDR